MAEGENKSVSTLSAKKQQLEYNWHPVWNGKAPGARCKERGGARPCGTILESHVGDTWRHHRCLDRWWGAHVLTLHKVWALQLRTGLPEATLPVSALPRQNPQEWSHSPPAYCSFAVSPLPLPSTKGCIYPYPLPSGLQQLISVPQTATHCVIIRYVNPMCQRAI